VTFSVLFSRAAIEDLNALSDYIAERAGEAVADGYIDRIEAVCRALCAFPLRGSPREDVAPGLRTIAFERSATIAYRVTGSDVTMLRVLYRGRDLRPALRG